MAILDNAIWLTGSTGTAESGTTTLSEGGFSTTVTGTFTADAWDDSQGGNNVSEFGAFGVSSPITADYLFSNPVESLSFDINHVNDSTPTYDDYWTIYAYDESGVLIPAATVIAGLSNIQDELIITNPDGSVSINSNGGIANDIGVSIAGPVSQLTLVMEPGPEGTQAGSTGISDLSFTIPDPNDNVVTGTTGDDNIGVGYADSDGTEVDGNDALGTHGETVGSNADSIYGGDGGDTINAGAGDDTVAGGSGADSIIGGDGADLLFGKDGIGGGVNPNLIAGGSFEGVSPTTFGQLGTLNDWFSWNPGSPDLNEEGGYEASYAATGAPTDGSNFASLVYSSTLKEGMSQDLAAPLLSGTEYTITFNAAAGQYQGSSYNGPAGGSVEVEVWGNPTSGEISSDSATGPAGAVLLGTATVTADITTGLTELVTITFTPTTDIETISLSAFDADISGVGSFATIMVDEVALHLSGELDTDTISGGIGDDTIFADGGNDVVDGGNDNDVIDGGAGDDTLYGGAGDDSVTGGEGDDSIEAWFGADTLIGGAGNDYLDGAQDADYLDGGDGDDTLLGGSTTGEDTIYGGAGNDSISSGGDNDLLFGGSGEDSIFASTGDDTIFGEDDADLINAGDGNDSIDGGSGNDTVLAGAGDDSVLAGAGDDSIEGSDGNDSIAGQGGNDYLSGQDGADDLSGGTGNDSLYGSVGLDTLDGGDGDDVLNAGNDADVLYGGAGLDTLYGGSGDDLAYGGDDRDLIYAGDGNDSVDGDAGDDYISGGAGDDLLTGGTGGDDFDGGDGNDTILGGDDNDNISGHNDNDSLEGGAGSDSIWGDAGDDTIIGGSGNDVLYAGAGNDSVDGGAGNEYIELSQGNDTVTAGDGEDSINIVAGSYLDGAIVTVDGGTGGSDVDALNLTSWEAYRVQSQTTDADSDSTSGVLELRDSSGNWITLNYSEIESLALPALNLTPNYIVEGTSGADDIGLAYIGDPQGEQIDNNDHSDGSNDDSVVAGDGNDTVRGGLGNDTVDAGNDDDAVYGESGDDVLIGGAGNDSLDGDSGSDSLDGGIGSDTLIGDAGDDTLSGGDGNDDIYVSTGSNVISGDGGNDLVFSGDGTDSISGGSGADTLYGAAGDDTIDGGTGDDSLVGSDGDDTFVLQDGFGNDTILGDNVAETAGDTLDLSGLTTGVTLDLTDADPEDGSVSDGVDTANFTDIENIMLGGGRDQVVLADASGVDSILGFDMTDSGDGTTNDQLDVSGLTDASGARVNTDDATVTDTNGDGSGDAIINFPNGESITLVGVSPAQLATPAQLASIGIPLSDNIVSGTSGADLIDASYLADPEGDLVDNNDHSDGSNVDIIEAGAGNDTVLAGAANDTVYGEAGDDSLVGEAGNDMLFGGDGADTMLGQDGNDTINDGAGDDYAEGGADADTFITQDLYGNDSIVGGETGVDDDTLTSLKTGDVTLDLTAGGTASDAESGTLVSGSDTVTFVEIENVNLGAGNDNVIGSDGADNVTTGSGQDTVDGGAGDDTFDLGAADGVADSVILSDGDGNDTVTGFEGPTDNGDGTFTGNDLLDVSSLTDAGGDPVNVNDVLVGDDGSGNAVLNFPNGESVTLMGVAPGALSDPLALEAVGIPGVSLNYIVEGTAAGDLITELYTDDPEGDLIDNNDAADGSDDDLVYGYGGDDVIQAGDGNDTAFGGVGDDQLYGGDGNDSLDGGVDNDQLYGGLGDDTILGGAGNDSIFASTGADSIDAGDGDDTIRFTDDDTVLGGGGDDLFRADTLVLDGSPISITGGETGETGGDTLFSGSYNNDVTVDLTAGGTAADPESGTMQLGTTTVTFSEIETVQTGTGDDVLTGSDGDDQFVTGAGADTVTGGAGDDSVDLGLGDGDRDVVVLADGDGSDTITGFDLIDSGDGTTVDQLDVTGLTSDGGTTPVQTDDVVVTDTNGDGTGDAILTFPGGESITLVGVLPAQVDSAAELAAIGIPNAPLDFIVEGTAGSDTIDAAYDLDPQGDSIDANDASDGSNDDLIIGNGGNDSVLAGDGQDTIRTGSGDDTVFGGADGDTLTLLDGFGQDSLFGGEGVTTGTDTDLIEGGALTGDVTLSFSGDEQGALSAAGSTADFEEIEAFNLGSGNDVADANLDSLGTNIFAGAGDDTVTGGTGDDTLAGDAGDDSLSGGAGADNLSGGTGQDTLYGGADNDTLVGGGDGDILVGDAGDDQLFGNSGADTLTGGSGADQLYGGADGDVLNVGSGDAAYGNEGDDTFNLTPADLNGGNVTIIGGESDETVGDTLNVTGPADIVFDDPTNESGTITYYDTGEVVTFSEIENLNYIPCFTPGTLIKTAQGEMPAEEITIGTRVLTRDHGYQSVVWAGQREIDSQTLARHYALKPIRILRGAFGPNTPERDMLVSPQHRVLVASAKTELWFGEEEVLIPAKFLTVLDGVDEVEPESVTYIHFMFEQHQVVMSDGCWSESFQPGDLSLGAIGEKARNEILYLFPELDSGDFVRTYPAARPTLDAKQARVLFS